MKKRMTAKCGRAAFSLVEVMIAIGILGIGMAMIAAIFPAAIKQNEISANCTLGKIICENGLTLGRISLTADTDQNKVTEVAATTLAVYADESKTDVPGLGNGDQHYPSGESDSRLGFVLLARKIDNGYQLVTVAYRKANAGNTVTAEWTPWTVVGPKKIAAARGALRVGSPVIDCNGSHGILASVVYNPGKNRDEGTFIFPISLSGSAGYIIVESDEDRRSPAIAVMGIHTGLRP